jgi:serine protease Do
MIKNCIGVLTVVGMVLLTSPVFAAKDGSSALDLAKELNKAFIEVAEKVSPSVVVIQVWHKPDYEEINEDDSFLEMLPREWRRRFEEERERQKQNRSAQPWLREPDGQGSGVIIREDGYILTNRHVVDGAERVRVRLKNGKSYPAEIRGVDVQSDIAVVKIDAKALKAAKLADSSQTKVGEFAIAIGAPFDLDYSVTYGHVSAKGRSNVVPLYLGGRLMDQDFIQTDASINPGNSGGPLINLYGEVIGVNTLIRGLNTGIGFAVPSSLAKEVSDKLIAEGKYRRSWLGIGIEAVQESPDYQGMLPEGTEGVIVGSMVRNGPARKSDLKLGDVITKVDGKSVATPTQLKAEIRGKPIGNPVTLDVLRNSKPIQVKVKTEEWPDYSKPIQVANAKQKETDTESLGLRVETLTRDLAEQNGVELTQGVLVTGVERNSLAARKGIRPGDIVTELNHSPIKSAKQFRDALKDVDLKRGVALNLIMKEGDSRFVILKDSGE